MADCGWSTGYNIVRCQDEMGALFLFVKEILKSKVVPLVVPAVLGLTEYHILAISCPSVTRFYACGRDFTD